MISLRFPFRRQIASLPELWRNNTRTSRNRDSVPRLLTSLQAMWLLDLRERPKENYRRNGRDGRVKRHTPNAKVRVLPSLCLQIRCRETPLTAPPFLNLRFEFRLQA